MRYEHQRGYHDTGHNGAEPTRPKRKRAVRTYPTAHLARLHCSRCERDLPYVDFPDDAAGGCRFCRQAEGGVA